MMFYRMNPAVRFFGMELIRDKLHRENPQKAEHQERNKENEHHYLKQLVHQDLFSPFVDALANRSPERIAASNAPEPPPAAAALLIARAAICIEVTRDASPRRPRP
jgi:hypothetical protein